MLGVFAITQQRKVSMKGDFPWYVHCHSTEVGWRERFSLIWCYSAVVGQYEMSVLAMCPLSFYSVGQNEKSVRVVCPLSFYSGKSK